MLFYPRDKEGHFLPMLGDEEDRQEITAKEAFYIRNRRAGIPDWRTELLWEEVVKRGRKKEKR